MIYGLGSIRSMVQGLRQRDSQRELLRTVHATIDEFADQYQALCMDAFSTDGLSYFIQSHEWANWVIPSFADGVHGDGSCSAPCQDRFRPICRAGRCEPPMCSDAVKYCADTGAAGERARLWCPVTCGCNDALSPLVNIGANSGCAPSCRDKANRQIEERQCTDTPKDSPEFLAFVAAAGHESKDESAVRALGCRHVLRDPTVWCATKYINFCPASCGCKSNDPGCPSTCPSTPPARPCADFLDHEFSIVAAAAGANASSCEAGKAAGLCSIPQAAAICPVTCRCAQDATKDAGYCSMRVRVHTCT